jgi:alpha-mannosidase
MRTAKGGTEVRSAARRRVHVVPQTHYDAEVFLSREETFEMGFRNIELALRLLAAYPGYTFALDQVCYVQPYLARYPEKRSELLRYAREGRLPFEGASHVMPDMNLPCGESFIRQVLYGREFFDDELGVRSLCAWTLDSFGYHPQTPQLLAGCGFDWDIIQRGISPGTPADFLWEGIDGTKLTMHCMPLGYAVFWGAPSNIHEFRKFADARLATLERDCRQPCILALTGADITPPEAHLPAMMEEYNRLQDRYELVFSTPARYLEELRAAGTLPVVRGDFNGVFHGCYSARIAVKKRNRELETALLDWEKADAAAALALPANTRPLQCREQKDAWEPVLFNQFHDIICGSHVDVVYRAALDRFDFSEELARTATARNLQAIADSIDTSGDGVPVVVFNTLGHARSDAVEAGFAFTGSAGFEVEVRDSGGRAVPSDLLSEDRAPDGSILRGRVLFVARDVPSFGYEVYRILPLPAGADPAGAAAGAAAGASDIRTSTPLNLRHDLDEGFIENSRVRVTFDLWRGVITSLVEKTQGWETIAPGYRRGNTIVREQDFGNFWQYNGPCKGDLFHPPMDDGISRGLYPLPTETTAGASFSHLFDGDGNIRTGRAHAEFSIDHPWGSGWFSTRVRLYAGLPRVEVTTTLVNNDERVRYRVAVPTSVRAGTITHEIPFGAIERPEGEYPAQTWMDYGESGPAGSRGIALLNRGLPGNNVADGVMMLSLLKCTALKEGYGEGGGFKLGVATEQGYEKGVRHVLRYALVPHPGDWRQARVWQEGHGFNTPLIPVKSAPHPGELPAKRSWVSVSEPQVVISAVRRGKRGIVVRVYEAAGRPVASARVELDFAAREVLETDLVERGPRPLPGAGGRGFSFPLAAFQIRTFEIVT